MTKMRVADVAGETAAEAALRQWFAEQEIKSPDNLEAAAKLLISLVTGLLGLLFTVLAVAEDPLPGYLLQATAVRWGGVAGVVFLFLTLWTALLAALPLRVVYAGNKPDEEAAAFAAILRRKSRCLFAAYLFFGLALSALSFVLIAALLLA